MSYDYQEQRRYFAQIAGSMEDLGAEELAALGAEKVRPAYRGAYFEAEPEALYRINYTARLLTRVIAPLRQFPCRHSDQLYKQVTSIEWSDFFGPQHTFAVFAHVSHSQITHSHYAALRVKDGIADYFRERLGKRPDVDTASPDLWVNLHLENDRATLGIDTSGGSLHRRGYRRKGGEAPLQETLAAAIVRLSGWEGKQPLYDPLCGSGTLLSEALMAHCEVPAGYLRPRFGFERLPDFDASLWKSVKRTADETIRPLPSGRISGSDIDPTAVAAARKNLRRLPSGEGVKFFVKDFRELSGLENTTILCNPPYGERLSTKEAVGMLYKALGDFLKQRCQGATAYIYFGDRALIPQIGLRPSWRKQLFNGPLDGRLARFEIY